jgi:hypothetical protein
MHIDQGKVYTALPQSAEKFQRLGMPFNNTKSKTGALTDL